MMENVFDDNYEYENIELLPHALFVKIKAVYGSLKSAERRVADLMLKNFDNVRGLNISEVSDLAGCSEATVFRFSKRLGYENFVEFKKDCLQEATSNNVLNIFSANESPLSILKKTVDISIQSLQDTLVMLDEKQFCMACGVLKNANRIVSFGIGDAAFVAESLYSKLLRINKETYTSVDIDFIDVICSHLEEGDALVCFSHSGASKKVIQVAKLAQKRGATVIAITNYPLSQLAKVADIALFTASFAESVEGEIISKRLPELCIAESLFVSILMDNQKYEDALKQSVRSVEHNKI